MSDGRAEESAVERRIHGGTRPTPDSMSLALSEPKLSLDEVIVQQERPLLRYAARITRNQAAAQDVVQTVLIRLCRHWSRLAVTPERIVPWLYRTTHNAAVDLIRREERLRRATEAMIQEAPSPNPGVPVVDERRQCVESELARLPPSEREVLWLRLDAGLSYRQIAEITGRTVGTVGCLLHNAVRRIAAALNARGEL